mgnify:CR=1 FL=1
MSDGTNWSIDAVYWSDQTFLCAYEGELHTSPSMEPGHHCPYGLSSQYIPLIIMALSFISKRPYCVGFRAAAG